MGPSWLSRKLDKDLRRELNIKFKKRKILILLVALGIVSIVSLQSVGASSAASTPQSPANQNASLASKQVLQYLKDLPKQKKYRVISGQHMGRAEGLGANNMLMGYQNFVEQLQAQTGHWVGLIGASYGEATPGVTPPYLDADQLLTNYWNKGGLVAIVFMPPNPWTGGDQFDTSKVGNLADLVTPGNSAYTAWHAALDNMALDLAELQKSGVVVLFRVFPEQNASWFWWGTQGANSSQKSFYELWRHTFTYMTKDKGLNNLLWVYAASARASTDALYFYPGNNYVDIVGMDDYEATGPKIAAYDELTSLGKPLALAEFGPNVQTAQKPDDYDWTYLLNALKTQYPAFSYFMAWSGGPGVYQSLIDNKNVMGLLDDPVIANLYQDHWSTQPVSFSPGP